MGGISFFYFTFRDASNNRFSSSDVFGHGVCALSFREEGHLVVFESISLSVKYDGFELLEAEIDQ